jgi:hypothetical protein
MTDATIPAFCDGWLLGLILGDPEADWGKGDAIVRLQRYDHARFDLTLMGLRALHVERLREINEIDELVVVTGEPFPSRGFDNEDVTEVFERLFPPPHPDAAKQYHDQHSALLADWIAKVENGAAALVSITGTADLIALCASVALNESPLDAPV